MSTSTERRITRALNRDLSLGLRAPEKRSTEPRAGGADGQADTSESIRLSHARTQASLDASHSRTAAALSVPCPTHLADVGESCWKNAKGYCVERLAAGLDATPLWFELRDKHGDHLTATLRERLERTER